MKIWHVIEWLNDEYIFNQIHRYHVFTKKQLIGPLKKWKQLLIPEKISVKDGEKNPNE